MKKIIFFYLFLLFFLNLFSYTFIDANLPLFNAFYTGFTTTWREITTIIYLIFIILISTLYFFIIKVKDFSYSHLRQFALGAVIVLFFAYPAMLSYDIFNYITTAKVTFFYQENPYLVMPIEFLGDSNLAFTRAANKIALYGPAWILFSAIPYVLGFGQIILTVFSFKLFVAIFYLAAIYLLWRMSKDVTTVLLFAANPLVLVETLVSSHNDIVMMFFALSSFYFLQKRKLVFGVCALCISILIKYATLVLLPIFMYVAFKVMQKEKVNWSAIFSLSGWAMFGIFLLSPFREEFYPWYSIWFLFFAILSKKSVFLTISLVLSFSMLLRYLPILYTGSYGGIAPIAKEMLTFVPLVITITVLLIKKIIYSHA